MPEVVDVVFKYQIFQNKKQHGKDKQYLLAELSKISGVYIPAFYKAEYDSFGEF